MPSKAQERRRKEGFRKHKVGYTKMRCGCGWEGAHTAWRAHRQTVHGVK